MIIDCDSHVLEPANLWRDYLEPKFRDQAVRAEPNVDGSESLLIANQVVQGSSLAMLSHEDRWSRMRQPGMRARIPAENPKDGDPVLGALLANVFPFGERPNYGPPKERGIAGIAAKRGVDAWEVMYDLLVGGDERELFYQPLDLGGYYDLDQIRQNLAHPHVPYGLSYGGVITDAGAPGFILAHWARDRKCGQLPVKMLVHSLSHKTAMACGLQDRCALLPGLRGDANVIDFANLQLDSPEAIYDLPAGGRRLIQRVTGDNCIAKSGTVTFDHGKHTGESPRMVLHAAH